MANPPLSPSHSDFCVQVPECELDPPRPQVQVWSGSHPAVNTLARWPNTTGWPSAWDVTAEGGVRHVLQYNITDGWQTNLIDSLATSDGPAAYSYMGSTRVAYQNITKDNSSYLVHAWPQTRNWSQYHGAEGAAPSRGFYFATQPFNETHVYNTSVRVWGNFTVYATHLSNNDSTIGCFATGYDSSHGSNKSVNCSVVGRRHLQCPFTFRCFSPEMAAATGPRCLDDFDNGYNDTDVLGTLTNSDSPKDAYGEYAAGEKVECQTVRNGLTICGRCTPNPLPWASRYGLQVPVWACWHRGRFCWAAGTKLC